MFDLVKIIVLALIVVHSIAEMLQKLREIKSEYPCSWQTRVAHVIAGAVVAAPVIYYAMELAQVAEVA